MKTYNAFISDLHEACKSKKKVREEGKLDEGFKKGDRVKVKNNVKDNIGKKYTGKSGTVFGIDGNYVRVKVDQAKSGEVEFHKNELDIISEDLNEGYAIYHKGKVFDSGFDSKEDAQDAMNGMDLSDKEKKDYKIMKMKGKAKDWSMKEDLDEAKNYNKQEIEGLTKNAYEKKILYVKLNPLGNVDTISPKEISNYDYKVFQYKLDNATKLSPLKLRGAIQNAIKNKDNYYIRAVKNNPIELIMVMKS
jgi:ribosomal protein L21E